MLEEGKISNRQFIYLLVTTIISTSILLFPAIVYKEVKQDSWLTIFPLVLWGVFSSYILVSLGLRFKDKTIIQYSEVIVGKVLGKVIAFVYCIYFIHINSAIIRDFADLIAGAFLTQTSEAFFAAGIILVSTYAVYSGLEVISRVDEFIFPLFIMIISFVIVFSFNDMEFKKLTPILAEGLAPIAKGFYMQAPYINQMIVMTMLIPYVNNQQKLGKSASIAVIIIGIIQILTTIGIIAVLGNTTGRLNYPFLSMARYISIAGIVERLESLIAFIWIVGVFVKITVFYYCAVLSFSQLLNLKSYKPFVIPIGIILLVLSTTLWDNIGQLIEQTAKILPIPYLFIEIGIPTILLIIAKLRKKGEKT